MKPKPVRSIHLLGKRCRLVARELDGLYGVCDYETNTITIDPGQDDRELMDTVIHECLHFILPRRNEQWVARASSDLTRLLYDKMEYRRTGGK